MDNNNLIIVDGNSIFYRSFYALPLLKNNKGEPCNAIYGFMIELVKIIQTFKPKYLAVAFDKTRSKERTALYSEYKANRKKAPAELLSQLGLIGSVLDVVKVPYFAIPDFEGDDVVGTLAKKFEDKCNTYIISSDRDLFQLISDKTHMLYVRKGISETIELTPNVLKEKFGFLPKHVVDIKALAGDTSDNIPGIAGIGEKSAEELVVKFDTIENIIAHIDEIKPRQKAALEGKENVWQMCRKLATIKIDVPLGDVKLEDLLYEFPFNNATKELFVDFGFKTLTNKPELFSSGNKDVNLEMKEEAPLVIEEINSAQKLDKIISQIKENKECSVYESDDYIMLNVKNDLYKIAEGNYVLCEKIAKFVLKDCKINKILIDNKVFYNFAKKYGGTLSLPYFDLMIADHLSSGKVVKSVEDFVSKNSSPSRIISDMPKLAKTLEQKIRDEKVDKLFYDVETPLSLLLNEMSDAGFKVKTTTLIALNEKLNSEAKMLESEIYKLCGGEFNIRSPRQLASVLYEKLGLPGNKKGSTKSDILDELADRHPVIPLLQQYRKITKFIGTYLEGFIPYVSGDGFVHTKFNQTLTNTGRLSSSEPNMQNIPIRGEGSEELRTMFCPRSSGNVLVDGDYSQIELRLLAAFSGDPLMIDAFNRGCDIHTETASEVFGVPKTLVTTQMRRIAKVVNFGIIYGISGFGLAQDLKINSKEAKKYIDSFFEKHPKVKEYMSSVVEKTKQTGKAYTMLGRFRNMDAEINSHNYLIRSSAERAAENMPLQGSAADIIKLAMINVDKTLKKNNLKAKLISQIHDELIVDCPKEEEELVKQIMHQEMENVVKLQVPLIVDISAKY